MSGGQFFIHHGTFRFEQGNPELTPEWTVEGRVPTKRAGSNRGWSWRADGLQPCTADSSH